MPMHAAGCSRLQYLRRKWSTSSGMSSVRSRSGGHGDRHDVQPVEQVLAEMPALDHRLARSRLVAAMTRTSTLERAGAAHPLELALLQHPQQLGLQLQGQLADLVQEQRAAVAPARTGPCWRATAPVNAPFSWPNSSLSSSVSGRAAQLTVMNGRFCAGAVVVDRPGHQLLAGAGLARDQHRGLGGGDHLDRVVDLAHHLGDADDAAERVFFLQLILELDIFSAQGSVFGCAGSVVPGRGRP